MAEHDARKPDARKLDEIQPAAAGLQASDDDLPVVARLVIEIRSDGTRTVARGGLEQAGLAAGADGAPERVAIEARGGSPAALAADLLRAIVTMPFHSSLSRWTGRDGQVAKASLEHKAGDSPGLVGRVRRELAGRLRRRLDRPR